MGTSRDSGGQTGGHVLKFWKNEHFLEKIFFLKLIILLSKTTCDDFI